MIRTKTRIKTKTRTIRTRNETNTARWISGAPAQRNQLAARAS